MAEYDKTIYVAPGVLRIAHDHNLLKAKLGIDRDAALKIARENTPCLDLLLEGRRERVKRKSLHIDPKDVTKIQEKAIREYMVEGALGHNALCYAGFRGAPLSTESGLPLLNESLVADYLGLYSDNQNDERNAVDIVHFVERVDPVLVEMKRQRATQITGIVLPQGGFKDGVEVAKAILGSGKAGVESFYVSLVEQHLINTRI
jgi:hypothetical protein